MRGTCTRCGSVGVGGISCDEGFLDYAQCPHFHAESGKARSAKQEGEQVVPWTGNTLGVNALAFVAARGPARLLGLVGRSDAGKSTFLSLFYLLLARGAPFSPGLFAGSYTFEGWENLAQYMQMKSPELPTFPPHTPSGTGRVPGLLHWAVREYSGRLADLLLTDASGEWFENWALNENAESAGGARWVVDHAQAFLLFIDCARLAGGHVEAAEALLETLRLAQRLRDHARGRRVGLVWAKADHTPLPGIRDRLTGRLAEWFPDSESFWVSTEMVSQPGKVSGYLDAVAWATAPRAATGTPFPALRAPGSDLFYQIGNK
jgi:hypothetical protein